VDRQTDNRSLVWWRIMQLGLRIKRSPEGAVTSISTCLMALQTNPVRMSLAFTSSATGGQRQGGGERRGVPLQLSAAQAALHKAMLRSGSTRRRLLAALRQNPEALSRKRLLLPSLVTTASAEAAGAEGKEEEQGEQVLVVEREVERFKGAHGNLHPLAEVPLYCVTVRQLARRGHHSLADSLARKWSVAAAPDGTNADDQGRVRRIFSALLEGHCMHRQVGKAVGIYRELVEIHDSLPLRRSLHMLMDLLASRQLKAASLQEGGDRDRLRGQVPSHRASDGLSVPQVFKELRTRQGFPTTAACNILLRVVESDGQSWKNILDEMKTNGVPCNGLTWSTILPFSRSKDELWEMERAMATQGGTPQDLADTMLQIMPKYAPFSEVLDYLKRRLYCVHAPTFNFLINFYSRRGDFSAAYGFSREMHQAQFPPSKKAFLSFLKCGGSFLKVTTLPHLSVDITSYQQKIRSQTSSGYGGITQPSSPNLAE